MYSQGRRNFRIDYNFEVLKDMRVSHKTGMNLFNHKWPKMYRIRGKCGASQSQRKFSNIYKD